MVSCVYSGAPERPLFWPIMSAMGMSYSFLPNAVFAAATGLEAPCLGASMAIRQTTLAEVGGFERIANALADDYELGLAVRAEGYSVALLMSVVRHNAGEKRISDFLTHELRWARTIRMINPIGYALSAITHNVGFRRAGCRCKPHGGCAGHSGLRHWRKVRCCSALSIARSHAGLVPCGYFHCVTC